MKTVIFYSSTYNGNTLKIAESIAATLSADLIAIETKISDFDLSQYDLIGIGSAIHFGQHAIRLQRFVSALPLQGKNIFIFSTRCRPFLGNYHRTLKNIIKQKKANLVDEFSCVGFDRTGPWVLINGYNKNRPNTNDLFKARLFAEKLQCKLHPLSSVITSSTATESKQGIVLFQKEQNKIANNKVVFLNISSCIQCSKCINICPMNVFQKKDAILPIHGENCIQCQLCAKDFLENEDTSDFSHTRMNIYFRELGNESPLLVKLIMQSIYKNNDRKIRHLGSKRFGIQFLIKGIYTYNGMLYVHTQTKNSSNVPFDTDFIKFKIVDKKVPKRTAIQETVLDAVRSYNEVIEVAGKSVVRTVYALPKFTIPDDKLLLVELYEKNGGRHQVIRVENADIVNAEVINELKIK